MLASKRVFLYLPVARSRSLCQPGGDAAAIADGASLDDANSDADDKQVKTHFMSLLCQTKPLQAIDKDNDGALTLEEFLEAYSRRGEILKRQVRQLPASMS